MRSATLRFLSTLLALGAAMVLTVASPATVRLLATAIVMDGTTLPSPAPGFVASAIDDFIVPTVPGTYTGVPLTTPEHVVGIHQSIEDGAAALEAAIAARDPDEPVVVFGYSQSTQIISLVKSRLEAKSAGEPVPNVTFVGIGGGDWAANSITSRLAGIVVPIIDFRFAFPPPNNPDGPPSIQIVRQYDGLADTVQFVTNPIALANSLIGALSVHGLYAQEVSLDPDSPKYVPETITQQDGSTTYYFIPNADLPLFDGLRIAGAPEGLIDIVEPFFARLVEAGYDRSVPFSTPTPAQLFPVIDPVTLTIQLVGAVLEGANNAAKLVGVQLPGYEPLAELISSAEQQSATTIGKPYGDAMRTLNQAVNPIQTFAQIEGPIALQFNHISNALGIPDIANAVLDTTLVPVAAWAERNILAPEKDAQLGPFATLARDVLKRVAPNLDADKSDNTADSDAAAEIKAARAADESDTPKPLRTTTTTSAAPGDDDAETAPPTDKPEKPSDTPSAEPDATASTGGDTGDNQA